jgi:hypothetical protein
MNKSNTIKELATALTKAQAEMQAAPFNAVNPFLKNKYADLGSIVKTAQPVLAKHGLSVSQLTEGSGREIGVTTVLMHSSGEWLESTVTLPVGDEKGKSDAQVAGSVISYLRRYSLAAILGMYAEQDSDGEKGPAGPSLAAAGNASSMTSAPAQPKSATPAKPAPASKAKPAGNGNSKKSETAQAEELGNQLWPGGKWDEVKGPLAAACKPPYTLLGALQSRAESIQTLAGWNAHVAKAWPGYESLSPHIWGRLGQDFDKYAVLRGIAHAAAVAEDDWNNEQYLAVILEEFDIPEEVLKENA